MVEMSRINPSRGQFDSFERSLCAGQTRNEYLLGMSAFAASLWLSRLGLQLASKLHPCHR
jgi:hypothetical protein